MAAVLPGHLDAPQPVEVPALLTRLRELEGRIATLELHLHQRDEQRRAMLHIMGDLHEANKRLSNQRKAMLHILIDYERDRQHTVHQTARLDSSRRALLHILQDSHRSNLRLEQSRKAMIHIMSDLHDTTAQIQGREQELRDKQEQLVQAGKLATLGELTTGIAHELNNPLNNIGLFIGNIIDRIELGRVEREHTLTDLHNAMQQVRKATAIISHLRTFGRTAHVSHEPVSINEVVRGALSLMQEQLRLRQVAVTLELDPVNPMVAGSPIQLEQVFINLFTNARDALMDVERRGIAITVTAWPRRVDITFQDTGPGISPGMEQRIFDPFFTTKGVGEGTGLGLSITYGIVKDHRGSITVVPGGSGAMFLIQIPRIDGRGDDLGEQAESGKEVP
jgi:C4-dicarboxylate-specific signal transduction histidine kinase